MKPRFFNTPAQFRQWLERNHEEETRVRRLQQLIEGSAKGVRIRVLNPKSKD